MDLIKIMVPELLKMNQAWIKIKNSISQFLHELASHLAKHVLKPVVWQPAVNWLTLMACPASRPNQNLNSFKIGRMK